MAAQKLKNSEWRGKRHESKEENLSLISFQANSQLDTTRKNAEKRSGLAELAEKSANERIEEIKRDQWAVVEQIRSEKRETDSQLQKEIENCNRLRNELDMSKELFEMTKQDIFFISDNSLNHNFEP